MDSRAHRSELSIRTKATARSVLSQTWNSAKVGTRRQSQGHLVSFFIEAAGAVVRVALPGGPAACSAAHSGVLLLLLRDQAFDKRDLGFFLWRSERWTLRTLAHLLATAHVLPIHPPQPPPWPPGSCRKPGPRSAWSLTLARGTSGHL